MTVSHPFQLVAPYAPAGDQPQAIAKLCAGLQAGRQDQVLLGVTGSGKTFTMANIIQNLQRPAMVMAHNKTLAAQLYQEMKHFFPHNAVEYFVSYYDYYQPEAYIARTDTFIEKDSSINEQIDRLRHSATRMLLERRDVIVIASVSCIYGIGSAESYSMMVREIKAGQMYDQRALMKTLTELQYERNDIDFHRGTFRVRGDVLDLFPAHLEDRAWRLSFFGDELERIQEFDPLTGEFLSDLAQVLVYPNSHYVIPRPSIDRAIKTIKAELLERLPQFESQGKLVEAQRLAQRTQYDLEMIQETGMCKGIENYSRHLSGAKPGEAPPTLFSYLPKDALLFVDESHVSVPQVGGMYSGDRSRKTTLTEHGFRLPSCMDNRPLKFEEWDAMRPQTVFVSATPSKWEVERAQSATKLLPPLAGGGWEGGAEVQKGSFGEGKYTTRDAEALSKAKELRKNPTSAEKKLWSLISRGQKEGYKFRRQQPVGSFIVDFVCNEKKLIIEVDGGQHAEQIEYDITRTSFLNDAGYRVLRFWNNEVMTNPEGVHQKISEALLSPLPTPPRKRGEEQKGERGSDYNGIVEQIIRPTGLTDPPYEIRPVAIQVDDLMAEARETIAKGYRVMVTTLTKRMAEELTDYLTEAGNKVAYLHSDVETLDRIEIIRDLRLGTYDILVGVNLLREGLDIPECGLMAILDADKEGFLRSATSLIQTIGRAARNVDSKVILYADKITNSMKIALDETDRRRAIQIAYNEANGITPQSIKSRISESMQDKKEGEQVSGETGKRGKKKPDHPMTRSPDDLKTLRDMMLKAAADLDFEEAARLRDELRKREGK